MCLHSCAFILIRFSNQYQFIKVKMDQIADLPTLEKCIEYHQCDGTGQGLGGGGGHIFLDSYIIT